MPIPVSGFTLQPGLEPNRAATKPEKQARHNQEDKYDCGDAGNRPPDLSISSGHSDVTMPGSHAFEELRGRCGAEILPRYRIEVERWAVRCSSDCAAAVVKSKRGGPLAAVSLL